MVLQSCGPAVVLSFGLAVPDVLRFRDFGKAST